MKAAIISPYFKTLGGGERYALTFAQALLDKDWEVDITIDDLSLVEKSRNRFNLRLNNLNIISYDRFLSKNFFKRQRFHQSYDLLFWVSDGSIPYLCGKKNILHFQIPFHDIKGKSFFNSLKFKKINKVVCNSLFTKKIIDQEYGINSDVWYPPVDVEEFTSGKKENYILAVGRFEKSMTEKRQDVLIDCFKKMVDQGLNNWRLILCGGCTAGNEELVADLKKMSLDYPIEFRVNATFSELKKLYAEAKVFWHSAGFGIDEKQEPEKTEHFGITTVEAMAAGCIPVVQGKGGQKEIVEEGKNGFLWLSIEELAEKTLKVIQDRELSETIPANAVKRSKDFSKEIFFKKVYSFLNE